MGYPPRVILLAIIGNRAAAANYVITVADIGVGEILLTSMDADGTKAGYDNQLNKAVADAVNIPVIASGGAGTLEHLYILGNAKVKNKKSKLWNCRFAAITSLILNFTF